MKNNFNGYERMLKAYLKRYHFAEAEDNNFITARADNALDVFYIIQTFLNKSI